MQNSTALKDPFLAGNLPVRIAVGEGNCEAAVLQASNQSMHYSPQVLQ